MRQGGHHGLELVPLPQERRRPAEDVFDAVGATRVGRALVGVEGDELTLPFAVGVVGNKPFIFSSDFPHEVNNETCKAELEELDENKRLTKEDKDAVRYRNAERFYGLASN